MENFRRPYLSKSVSEFWSKRWHISLASWFRDYMYIPMGGNRRSQLRRYFNVMSVFLVSGLWHGANWTFVVWGGLNGLYQVCSLLTERARQWASAFIPIPRTLSGILSSVFTFHLILVTWIFFRAASMSDAITIFSRVAGSLPSLPRLVTARATSGEMLFSISLIAVLMLVEVIDERAPIWNRLAACPTVVRWAVYYALLGSLVVFGVWNFKEFVYMQF